MRFPYWFLGFIVIVGNAYVIIRRFVRTSCFKKTWPSALLHCNHIVILNIAVADFTMGIYLITISIVHAIKYSEEFRRSNGCHILQCLTLVSSEASCFLMVTLTAFRLLHVYRPLSSITASTWSWKVCIVISWLVAVLLGIFSPRGLSHDYEECPFNVSNDLCLPRFFVRPLYSGWEYSVALITLNLTCFCFIVVGYILIYIHSTKQRPINAESRRRAHVQKREAVMQKQIAGVIITDCACWVPICIMAYAITGGWKPNTAIIHEVTAGFLLSINSALNPFLFSVDFSKLLKRLRCRPIKRCRN